MRARMADARKGQVQLKHYSRYRLKGFVRRSVAGRARQQDDSELERKLFGFSLERTVTCLT
jgi:hypothetical protein